MSAPTFLDPTTPEGAAYWQQRHDIERSREIQADWQQFYDTLAAEHYAGLAAELQEERATLAAHLRELRNVIGKARELAPVSGYLSETDRRMADAELCEAIARCDLLIVGLSRP